MALGRILLTALLLAACGTLEPQATQPTGSREPPASLPADPDTGSASPVASPTPFGDTITARYPDGLPSRIGDRPIARGAAALSVAEGKLDAEAFLVTGWVTYLGAPFSCPFWPGEEGRSWVRDCARARFADAAGAEDPRLSDAITFRYVLDNLASGPVVAVVRVHDPRSEECGSFASICEGMMVVLDIVWRGDEVTAPHPLTAEAVAATLLTIQGSSDMTAVGPETPINDCGFGFPAAAVFAVRSGLDRTPAVTLVQLEPTPEAMARVVSLPQGATGALKRRAIECIVWSTGPGTSSRVEYRRFIIGNAALLIRMHAGPTRQDRAFLERLEELLLSAAKAG